MGSRRAEEVNDTFLAGLKEYVLNTVAVDLFKAVIVDAFHDISKNKHLIRKQYIDQITLLTNKTTRARELLLNEDIDAADYKLIKTESESKINILEAKI